MQILQFIQTHAVMAAGAPDFMSQIGQFAMPIAIVAVAYFVLIRPMHRQENDRKERLESLVAGTKVVLNGGLLGRITKVDGEVATVELSKGVKVRVLKKEINDTQAHALKDEESEGKDKDAEKDKK